MLSALYKKWGISEETDFRQLKPGDYTDDFEATWRDVLAGCQGLLKELSQKRGEQDGTK